MNDPISGPITRDELRELASAPYGEALKVIRKHDPLFGRKDGEKFRWKVLATVTCTMYAFVEAASEDEANKLADKLNTAAFDYESEGDISIDSVEPDRS